MNPLRKIIQKTGFDLHRHRPKADYWVFLRKQNIRTVLDIGANTGQFATEAREHLPEAVIYSFEPLKECFDKLDQRNTNFNFALGDEEKTVEMHKSAYTPSSSLLKMSGVHKNLFPHTKEHSPEQIMVKKLDNLNLDLNKEILIKVDVQGFEDKVILGGTETFKKAKAAILETSFLELYEGQPTFDDLYQKLKLLGFSYKGSLQQKINQKTGEVVSEDSLFLRQ